MLWGSYGGKGTQVQILKPPLTAEMALRKSVGLPEANFIMCKMELLIAYMHQRAVGSIK